MAHWTVLIFVVLLISHGIIGHGDHKVQQHDHDQNSTNSGTGSGKEPRNLTEAYLYGTLSVAIVSILSLAGVIVIPFIKRKIVYNATMLVFMSLAVGTMASDALLHLIPEILGLHSHGEGNHQNHSDGDGHNHVHADGETEEDKPYLGKMVALLATLYALFLLEVFAHVASKIFKKMVTVKDSSAENGISKTVASENGFSGIEMRSFNNNTGHGHGHSHTHGQGHSHGLHTSIGGETSVCGMKPVALVILISDAMHNFADGLAIGAAFAKSSSTGFAVSIAVICHELPHEVGDFAILLGSGMSMRKALFLNFISALTCFAGLYPGVAVGEYEEARKWIFAAVAGGFLYVALVHMLREFREYSSLPWYLSVALQNAGLLLGFVIIYLLAVFEDKLGG